MVVHLSLPSVQKVKYYGLINAMNLEDAYKNCPNAFSTVEMLIAMAILSIVLTGVVLVSFGAQGMLVEGEIYAEAMIKAQELLEKEQQLARKDFRLVVPFGTTTDGRYTKSILVDPWPGDIFATKKVRALITWEDERRRSRSLVLSTLISNFTYAVGGDTCNAELVGNWESASGTDYQLAPGSLLPSGMGEYVLGGVDAYRGKLYIAAKNTSNYALPTFFVFDISNPPQKPIFLGSVDTIPSLQPGLNDVRMGNTVDVSGTLRTYAYVASANGGLYNGCTASPEKCAQMQVIDVTNPELPAIAANFRIATSSVDMPLMPPPFVLRRSAGQAVANTIFYKDGYVYMGLTKTGGGPEFNVIDVRNPLSPVRVGEGYAVGRGVESIYVRGNYAYLAVDATSGAEPEIIVLDVTNPLSPFLVPGRAYNPSGTNGGNRLFAVGDTLYFGKQAAGGPAEFYVLDITHPGADMPPPLGSKVVGASVMGLLVRDTLAFLVTSTTRKLHIFNLSNLASAFATVGLPGIGAALDCEGNTLYAVSNNGSAGYVSVIEPGQ